MVQGKSYISEDGDTYFSYDVIGRDKHYAYNYSDVTQNKDEAELLDLILSSGYISKIEANDFVAFFVEYISNK